MTLTEDFQTMRVAYTAQVADMSDEDLLAELQMLSNSCHVERLAIAGAELRRRRKGTMRWTRVRPGVYRSGPFVVERVPTGEWYACGPGGIDRVFDHKAQAQTACLLAAAVGA